MSVPGSSETNESTIVVIGAGIIGLTSALKIQQLTADSPSTSVLLVAKEWPTSIPGAPTTHSADYASMWAGAHIRPIPASTPQLRREAKWVKHTTSSGIEYLEDPSPEYLKQDAQSFANETGLPGYRKYEAHELPEGVKLGFKYETYCIHAPLYTASLLRKFIVQGGKTLQRDLKSEWEAFILAPSVKLVVNASGMGFGDKKCFPIRGQTKDGTWSFIIPRSFNGGTVIGGTKEVGNWQLEPSQETQSQLLKAAQPIIPQACDKKQTTETIKVIKDVVGRRPAREGGMRVETEARDTTWGVKHAIHAYGAGGRGFELSWGVASEVAELASEILESQSSARPKL
ncbi:D-amino-acid oxidase [Fusarium oxysporum f. sp. raphani]|uniref:D-amino-acid oxidase n=1 Tax=Fusarium oxysporum f. sp. raphani TaxID=96318 RepID=A0A8J5P4Y6_FUSOX|nr:D-amino-acid oxidase [Fusarium oxysporum f. sp. raphani]